MRLLLVSALLLIPASASAYARVVSAPAVETARELAGSKCANATRQFAHKGSVHRGEPARPKKLVELPPAETYAAVYRLENGCAVPVLYRKVRSVRAPGK